MTPFEYVTVLISIILGLGITQIVSGLADIIHKWSQVKLYWPHLMWIAFAFFLHIQEWWVLYEMRSITVWMLPTFLFTILYPINLFILARILFHSEHSNTPINYKEFYFDNFRKFFLWAVILIVLSIADNLLFNGYTWLDQPIQLILLIGMTYLIYKKPKQEWVHKAVVILLTALLLGSLILKDWIIEN
jgi:hypothetical protein